MLTNRKNNTKKLIFSVHIVNFPPEYLPISQKFTLGERKSSIFCTIKKARWITFHRVKNHFKFG